MESFLCFAVFVTPIVIIGWHFYETRQAVATTTVDSPYNSAQVAQIVRDAFAGPRAVLWATTEAYSAKLQ
ncbi:hypothetical protein EDC02_3495 [Micromonospora sp. Llam0]|uniref:hypothetical protein n=1 Tax=Micromonospora sp. Llam0 TaxID=2485143 RepID=UPI000F4AB4F4|nr:hypothetical protein [Micromonospora sp. Llam0]ROO61555.1 hypothetical protein EDC02_3495 [Micromonospora sp. Llam0]